MKPLHSLLLDELSLLLASRTRAQATLRWLWQPGAMPPSELPDSIPGVSRSAWQAVREQCTLRLPQVVGRVHASDQTTKFALKTGDATIEAVFIPSANRSTLCISSQSGCSRGCTFCATAQLGFQRHLDASEIVGQLLAVNSQLGADQQVRNIVFMGMGEPLDNLDAVLRAVQIFTQAPAPQLAAGHLTVSTSGVLPAMRRLVQECPAHLALSLNGTTDQQREELMPKNRSWSLADLMGFLRESSQSSKRLFFIEYVMFDGFNDTPADAYRMIELLRSVRARVNLIAHNPWETGKWKPSSRERMLAFQEIVHRAGIRCLLRLPRGQSIAAACGQLARKNLDSTFSNS